jgi:CDP-diacylglycerol---glycerol-3-phosphate 3-phosphatidyltransferase
MANLLTLGRVLLLFVVIGVWARKSHVDFWWLDLLMVLLLAWVIFMDALDGWVARRRHEESDLGALLDIAGDRIVELVLWVFFAIRQHPDGSPFVPYWVPVVIITRTVVTDLIRSVAFQKGKTPFGKKTMMESGWAKQLVSSRWSRASYGVMKAVAFCALGIILALERMRPASGWLDGVGLATDVLVYATAIFCVIRAIPVVWDGRRYFLPAASGGS